MFAYELIMKHVTERIEAPSLEALKELIRYLYPEMVDDIEKERKDVSNDKTVVLQTMEGEQ